MADESQAKSSGWRKAVVGGMAGIMSGGAMMYISPLLDRVIKPQKPLANFAVEVTGQQLTVHNRSVGDGFLDFGDGSELVPVMATLPSVSHKYSRVGTFPVKLTVRNYLGDENERSVPVEIKGEGNGAPAILSLVAVPPCERPIAPATFRFVSTGQNVETCVWDFGEEKPLEISSDSPNQQEKHVTFSKPGHYVVQLAVLNGKQGERKSVPIIVEAAPANSLMAVLSVRDQGMRCDSFTETVRLAVDQDGSIKPFEKFVSAKRGFSVVEAKLDGAPPAGVRNLAVLPMADKQSVRVTGETQAAKPTAKGTVPMVVVPVTMRMEKTWKETRDPVHASIALAAPGTTYLPLVHKPECIAQCQRAIALDLYTGSKTRLASVPIPCPGMAVTWQGKQYTLTAQIVGDQVLVTMQ